MNNVDSKQVVNPTTEYTSSVSFKSTTPLITLQEVQQSRSNAMRSKTTPMLFLTTFLLIFFFAAGVGNVAKAQECIDGSKIPAYYQPYQGPFETQFMISSTCTVKYTYCYRCDCPDGDCSGGSIYYDYYISSISFSGTCYDFNTSTWVTLPQGNQSGNYVAINPFDPAYYRTLYAGCSDDLLRRVNPWRTCDMNAMGNNIPPCETGTTPYAYRAGKPSCTSDFVEYWADGKHWIGTFPCNTSGLGYYCFNIFMACWKLDPDVPGGRYLDLIEVTTGTPSAYMCPPIYQLPPNAVTYPVPGQQVNCNAMCGE